MAFYLQPPKGIISLRNLEKFAEVRLRFLSELLSKSNTNGDVDEEVMYTALNNLRLVSDSDCLIERTNKDCISHFILRLAMSRDRDTSEFLLKAESALFKLRIENMSVDELYRFLKETYMVLSRIFVKTQKTVADSSNSIFLEIHKTFQNMKANFTSWRQVANLYTKKPKNLHFPLPFSAVPDLVAKRQVVIENGLALVPYCHLPYVIITCFRNALWYGIRKAGSLTQADDTRIKRLAKRIQIVLKKKYKPFSENFQPTLTNIRTEDVKREATLFPPCMSVLNHALKTRHRLKHNSRIQYTLFLKEIGMPVHEALQFWRKEYSTVCDYQDGCYHDWQSNEKRYTYNIRHLYGLEGSGINYRGHCCSSLQNFNPTCGECGGCPFKHFDSQSMSQFLGHKDVLDIEDTISDLCRKGLYTDACKVYMNKRLELLKNSNKRLKRSDSRVEEDNVIPHKRRRRSTFDDGQERQTNVDINNGLCTHKIQNVRDDPSCGLMKSEKSVKTNVSTESDTSAGNENIHPPFRDIYSKKNTVQKSKGFLREATSIVGYCPSDKHSKFVTDREEREGLTEVSLSMAAVSDVQEVLLCRKQSEKSGSTPVHVQRDLYKINRTCVSHQEAGEDAVRQENRENKYQEHRCACKHKNCERQNSVFTSKQNVTEISNVCTKSSSLSRDPRNSVSEKSFCDQDYSILKRKEIELEKHENKPGYWTQSSRQCFDSGVGHFEIPGDQKFYENPQKENSARYNFLCDKVLEQDRAEKPFSSLELSCYDHTICMFQVCQAKKEREITQSQKEREIILSQKQKDITSDTFVTPMCIQITKPIDFYYGLKSKLESSVTHD